ncbi:TetR-like C-terminal domain-containing protein [Streptomyces sp. NPDC005549]|uniref:TetR-like C-terminal domain-containing protein n=1 Tax=Streptomyces sp. NPDC005549 TaxID=3154888 RepID=UPI0033A04C11
MPGHRDVDVPYRRDHQYASHVHENHLLPQRVLGASSIADNTRTQNSSVLEASRSAPAWRSRAAAAARRPVAGDAVRNLFARRNGLPLALLDRAHERCALAADTSSEVLFDQLAGALCYRLLITGAPIGADHVEELVGQVLAWSGANRRPERN